MKYKYVLVVGSRTITDENFIFNELDKICDNDTTIVSGGASGVDTIAARYARLNHLNLKVMHADWYKHGRAAGFIRNEAMHKYISQFESRVCIAFWDGKSKGTQHSFSLAKKYNNPLITVECQKMP